MFSMVDVYKSSERGAREVQILRRVSLSVAAGEIVGIVGSREEGSTTLRVAAGFTRPDSGQMRLGEVDLLGLSGRRRRRLWLREILWIDQRSPPRAMGKNARQTLGTELAVIEGFGLREAERLAQHALEKVGGSDLADLSWEALSRWDRLLVGLARVIATGRRLVLIDELLDGLAIRRIQEAQLLLRSLAGELGCGMLLSLSDLQSAWLADRVWRFSQGVPILLPDARRIGSNVIALPQEPRESGGWRDRASLAGTQTTVPTQASTRIDEMPAISRFSGITIAMYFDDHQPPHFHARSGEFSAKIRTDTLELLAGDLPRRELRLVFAWAELHASELQDNWRRARAGETLKAIEPLR
jgi:ABC-type cobalamin/Fe3+-siderophores transport system ATPase subunit